MKNHRREDQDFLVKMGDSPYRWVVYRRRGKQCFLLIRYGFCSSNALYSASLSFRMFIFFGVLLILEIVTIWDVYKKACNVFYSSKNEEITLPHEVYFCVLPIFHWGDIVGKSLAKSVGFRKI